MHKAVVKTVSGTTDTTGMLKIQFQTVVDGAYCSAIQIFPVSTALWGGTGSTDQAGRDASTDSSRPCRVVTRCCVIFAPFDPPYD
jgi:hypothetical protein